MRQGTDLLFYGGDLRQRHLTVTALAFDIPTK